MIQGDRKTCERPPATVERVRYEAGSSLLGSRHHERNAGDSRCPQCGRTRQSKRSGDGGSRGEIGDKIDDLTRGFTLLGDGACHFGNVPNEWPMGSKIEVHFLTCTNEAVLHSSPAPIPGLRLLTGGMRIGKRGSQVRIQGRLVLLDSEKTLASLGVDDLHGYVRHQPSQLVRRWAGWAARLSPSESHWFSRSPVLGRGFPGWRANRTRADAARPARPFSLRKAAYHPARLAH